MVKTIDRIYEEKRFTTMQQERRPFARGKSAPLAGSGRRSMSSDFRDNHTHVESLSSLWVTPRTSITCRSDPAGSQIEPVVAGPAKLERSLTLNLSPTLGVA